MTMTEKIRQLLRKGRLTPEKIAKRVGARIQYVRQVRWQMKNPGYFVDWCRARPGYRAESMRKWRRENPELAREQSRRDWERRKQKRAEAIAQAQRRELQRIVKLERDRQRKKEQRQAMDRRQKRPVAGPRHWYG